MRLARVVGIGMGAMIMAGSLHASARNTFSSPDLPGSFADAFKILHNIEPQTGAGLPAADGGAYNTLPPYLEEAQCGGVKADSSILQGNGPNYTKIAKVRGLPGRDGEYGNQASIMTGMSKRKPDFIFPENAVGLATTCNPGQTSVTFKVWRPTNNDNRPGEVTHTDVTFALPKFENPPCLWRLTSAYTRPDFNNPNGNDASVNDNQIPTFAPLNGQDDYHNNQTCTDFCKMTNEFMYKDCPPSDQTDNNGTPENPADDIPYKACVDGTWKTYYLCSRDEVNNDNFNNACIAGGEMKKFPNSRSCRFEDGKNACQCAAGGGAGCTTALTGNYASFYRRYSASYKREEAIGGEVPGEIKQMPPSGDPCADDPKHLALDCVRAACFGLYDEYDPKTRKTASKDRRCILSLDLTPMRSAEMGKGDYGKNDGSGDPRPTDPDQWRIPNVAFNVNEDVWYKQLGWAYSVVNEKFTKQFDTLANFILSGKNFDLGVMRATNQLASKPLAVNRNQLAFDDSGSGTLVRWWQRQQTSSSTLLRQGTLRLLLPSSWTVGLAADDPLMQAAPETVRSKHEPRSDPIEIQLDAREDVLGDCLLYTSDAADE